MLRLNYGITKFSKKTELGKGQVLDRIDKINRIFGDFLQVAGGNDFQPARLPRVWLGTRNRMFGMHLFSHEFEKSGSTRTLKNAAYPKKIGYAAFLSVIGGRKTKSRPFPGRRHLHYSA
jgi:hypothetical protein